MKLNRSLSGLCVYCTLKTYANCQELHASLMHPFHKYTACLLNAMFNRKEAGWLVIIQLDLIFGLDWNCRVSSISALNYLFIMNKYFNLLILLFFSFSLNQLQQGLQEVVNICKAFSTSSSEFIIDYFIILSMITSYVRVQTICIC